MNFAEKLTAGLIIFLIFMLIGLLGLLGFFAIYDQSNMQYCTESQLETGGNIKKISIGKSYHYDIYVNDEKVCQIN